MISTSNKTHSKIISNIKHRKIMRCTEWWMKVPLNRLMIFQWFQALFFLN